MAHQSQVSTSKPDGFSPLGSAMRVCGRLDFRRFREAFTLPSVLGARETETGLRAGVMLADFVGSVRNAE
jgi:hypothetical protein